MRPSKLLTPDLKRVLVTDPASFVELVAELHPEDVADVLRELTTAELATALRSLPSASAARIFERLDDHEQRDAFRDLGPSDGLPIVAALATDRRAKFVRVLDEPARRSLLEGLAVSHPEVVSQIETIARYPDRAAGRLMTTSFVAVPIASTVGDALDALRAHGLRSNESVHAIYGIDESGRLAAFARLREVAPLPWSENMASTWRRQLVTVTPETRQEDVARLMSKYDLAAVPVVGADGELLGIITIDDIVDVLSADAARAFERAGAVEPLDLPYFRTSFLAFIRKRGLWLVVLFVEEFFTQTALRYYDPVFEAIRGASYYVPLLISTGGNSGSQSATLVIRGLSVREISPRDWGRILVREAGMGLVLGALLGLIGFCRVLMYRDQGVAFAATIGITLVGIVVVGCTVGSMLPLVLRKFGADPATSSTPFIASLVDVLGIIVFVHVAKLVMADVIARGSLVAHLVLGDWSCNLPVELPRNARFARDQRDADQGSPPGADLVSAHPDRLARGLPTRAHGPNTMRGDRRDRTRAPHRGRGSEHVDGTRAREHSRRASLPAAYRDHPHRRQRCLLPAHILR